MNRSTRIGFIVAIGGGLLALSPAQADPYVLVKFLALAVGGVFLWAGLLASPAPLRRTALDLPLAALWAVMLLSAAFSVDPAASVFGMYHQGFYGLLPLSLCAALYYAVAQVPDDAGKDGVLRWMVAASIPLAAYGISQRIVGDVLLPVLLPDGRIVSTLGNPVMLAACLAALLPLALHETLTQENDWGLPAVLLLVPALVLTWTRSAWLSAALGAALYLQLSGRLRARRRHALLALAAAPLLFFFLRGALNKSASDAGHLELAKSALAAIEDHPVLGWGPDTFMIALRRRKTDELLRLAHDATVVQFSAHDDVLQAAATLGLAGLLAYAWLLWALGAALLGAPRSGPAGGRAAAIAASLGALFLQAKLNVIPLPALALAALLAGLACRGKKDAAPAAGRAAAALALVFCAAAVLVLARSCRADFYFRRGRDAVRAAAPADPAFGQGLDDLRRAAALDPWTLEYAVPRCDALLRVAPLLAPEQGRALVDEALALTADAVRRHPGNPDARQLRAAALILSAARFGSGRLPEAFREIELASEMDPTLTFTMRWRMELDRALGNPVDLELTRAAFARVVALTGEDPNPEPALRLAP